MVKTGTGKRLMALILSFALCFSQPITAFALEEGGEQAEESVSEPLLTPEEAEPSEPEAETPPEQPEEGSTGEEPEAEQTGEEPEAEQTGEEPETEQTGDPVETEPLQTLDEGVPTAEEALRQALENADGFTLTEDITLGGDLTLTRDFGLSGSYTLCVPAGITLTICPDRSLRLDQCSLVVEEGGTLLREGWLDMNTDSALRLNGAYEGSESGSVILHADGFNSLPAVEGLAPEQMQVHKDCTELSELYTIFDINNSPFKDYALTVGKIRGRSLTLTGMMNIPRNALLNIEEENGTFGALTLTSGATLQVDGGVSVFDGCTLSCPAGAAVELRGYMEWYNAVNEGSVTLSGDSAHLECRGESFSHTGTLSLTGGAQIFVPDGFTFVNNGEISVDEESGVYFCEDTVLTGSGTWQGRAPECHMSRQVSTAAELLEAVWQLNGGAEGHRDIVLCNSITVTAADLTLWAETHPGNDWGGKVRFIGEYYLHAVNNAPGITLTVEPGISTYGRENRADLSFGLSVTLGGESETHTHFYVGAEQEGDVRTLSLTGTLNTYGHLDISREGALTVAEGGSLQVSGDGMQINGTAAVEEGGSFIAQYDTNVNINDEGSLTNNGSFALQNNARLHTSGCFINNGSVSVEEDCEFNHNGGTLENHGEWNGREPNRNLQEEVSTAAELVAAVSRMNAEEANCKELILRRSITLNGSDLPAEWEGCLTLIGDCQLRSDTEEGQPPYTLTLNCDLLTENEGEGYDRRGSLVLLCNLVLQGDFRANSYLRIAPDWGEDRSATLTLVSGHSMEVTGDMDISPLGSLVIEEGAALTVNYHCGIRGELCNNGTVNVAGEGYAELQEEGRYEGNGQWNGNPLAQNQWREVSTAEELLEAVEEMNAGPIGGRILHLQSSITVPDGEPLILVGDYNIQAERENYTLTLRRPTEIVGDEIGHASLNLRTNMAVENSFSAECWYQLGEWDENAPKGKLRVKDGGSLVLGNGELRPGSTLTVEAGATLTLREFMNCSGALTVDGSLLFDENGSMDVFEGGSLHVSGELESRAWNPTPIFVHGDCVAEVPEEAAYLLGYELDFELIEELAAFAEEWHPGYYRLVYSGVGELTEDLTLSDNYQLCLPGTDYQRLCKLTLKDGVTLRVHNLSVAGELYIEEGATLLANGEVWIVQDYYQLLTNNGSVELADTAHLSFDGHIINNGSFINNGFTDFNGWLEGEGRWEMRGGVNVTRWAENEQELIELVNDLNNWAPDTSRMIRFTLPITLTQPLTLRGDYRFGGEGGAMTSLTVAEGGSLTIEGRYEEWGGRDGALAMEIPLTVEEGASLHFDAEHFSYLQMEDWSGSLRVYGEVDFGDCGKINVNEHVEVDGLPRSAYELCIFDVSDEQTLRNLIAAHEEDGGPTRMVYAGGDVGEASLTLSGDLYIPGNMVLEIAGWNGFRHELIIPEGKKLSLGEGGRLCVYWNGALFINGTLDASVGHVECENWEDFHLAENGSYLPNVGDVEAQVLEGMRNGWGWRWDCEMELTLHEDAEVRGYFPFLGKSTLFIPDGVTLTVTPGSELYVEGTDIVIQRGGCLINGGKMNLSCGSLTVEEGGTYTDLPDSMLAVRLYAAAVEGIGDRFSYYAACESTEDIKALLAEELACRGKGIVLEGAVTLTESLTLGENIELFLNGMEDKPCVLTIPEGVTLTIEGLLTLPPESAIIVEDGGTLILEESSSFEENGALTVAEGGTLIRRGFTSISREISSEEELRALLAQTADIGYDKCWVDVFLTRSLTLGDIDLGGLNGNILSCWDEEAQEETTLTVTGHWQSGGELFFIASVTFTESSLLENSGLIMVGNALTVNGDYEGHYDGFENGWLIQPFALSGEDEGNIYIYGENILQNVTLSAAIPGEDAQAGLLYAIEHYAPAVSGCGELELFGAEAPCIEITEEITLPAGVRLVLASDTLIIRDGGKLINAEGAQVVLNPDSSLTIDEGGTFDSYEGKFYHLGGEFINNGTYIPNKNTDPCADGHDWDDATYAWSEDKSECTAKRVCKNDPAHVETATATVTGEITQPATCEEPGEKTYTATFAEDWAEEQTCTAAISATGHDWDDATYAWSEDYSECIATHVCANDHTHVETATATVSPYITDAGCETPGEAVYEAGFAEEWAEHQTATETLPALGHNWVFDRVDDSSAPYYNVFRCENCEGTKAEEVPTPKAVRVKLDCEAEETVYLNDMIVPRLELHAAVLPGNAMPELEEQVKWSGMNTAYGTFEQAGNTLFISELTGKTGTLTLTATAQDGSKVKSSVKLTFARRAESINILDSKGNDIEEYTLKGKQSYTFKTSIAADKSVTDKTLLWETDSDYVTVDAKGKVTVKSFAGEEITACLTVATAADPSVTDSITLHLSPNLSRSINIVADGERVNDLTLPVDINDGVVYLYAEPVELEGDVVWSSSSTKIATVNSDGTVELKGTGTVTVTAAVGKVKSSVKLTVVRYVENILVSESGTVAAGKSVTFTATVEPANASNKTLNWSLEEGDELYATLSKGKLTAAKTLSSPRTVTVHVDSADGCACAKFPVTLMPIATAVQIDGVPQGDVDFSESVKLTAEIEPLTASRSVKWSSSNKSFAIDEDGNITVADNAKSATVTFTATAQDGSGKKATAKIKFVRLMRDEDLTLTESVGVATGKAVTVKYTVNKAVTNQKLTWTLDDTAYATCKNNVVTAKKGLTEPVDVVLTATAQDGSGISKSCTVTIYPVASAVKISGAPEGSVDFSEALTLSAVVEPANALQSVKWSSSNKSFAIDEYGNITVADNAKSATVTFTATAQDGSGKKATAKIKFVRLMRDEDLTLSEMASVATGKAVTVKYTVNKAVTNQKLTWTLDDTTYATCKNNVVTAKKTVIAPQPVILTATAQDGSGVSKSCLMTIYPITTAVKLFDGGTEVTGKTVDFDGFAALDVVNTPDNAMASWTAKSSSSAVQVSMNGNMLLAQIAEGKTLKPGTKVTVTVTAADGSGKSAKVILNAVKAG